MLTTAYPIKRSDWDQYRQTEPTDLFLNEKEISLYFHIPFCTSLCKFCEYIRYKKDSSVEEKYIEILKKDLSSFLMNHSIDKINGIDIGGGTPTALDDKYFYQLMELTSPLINCEYPSIEATFNTLTEEKIVMIKDAGFKRISLGIQTLSPKLLSSYNREYIKNIENVINNIKKHNLIFNLDFMYGLNGQTDEDISSGLQKIIDSFLPNQITIYETRYNMLDFEGTITKEGRFKQYVTFYDIIKSFNYNGHFGKNTFTLNKKDHGLSSYLYNRTYEDGSYKGFGISAQSKSKIGLSYNVGKIKKSLEECMALESFKEEDIYILPKKELIAKYICIALYNGSFSIKNLAKILENNPYLVLRDIITFLLKNNLVLLSNDIIYLTRKGFYNYGEIAGLFRSDIREELSFENEPLL